MLRREAVPFAPDQRFIADINLVLQTPRHEVILVHSREFRGVGQREPFIMPPSPITSVESKQRISRRSDINLPIGGKIITLRYFIDWVPPRARISNLFLHPLSL